jgi:MraZ protein
VEWGKVENKAERLYGEYSHSIDEKNRLFIPARFRKAFKKGEKLVLSKGLDGCLFLFPRDEWKRLEDKTKTLPITARDARAFTRYLFSGASLCVVDAQGRIPFPPSLKEYADIEKEVVIIGVSNRIEIWAQQKWKNYCRNTENKVEDIAEKLEEKNQEPEKRFIPPSWPGRSCNI